MRALGLALACSALPVWAQCGILSWDAYKEVRHPLPYVLRLAAPPGELLMFGAQHTRDPHHAELSEIERLWREFRPQIAFSEGGIRPAASRRDESVVRYGEPGLVRFLADLDHVTLAGLEPPEGEEAAWLTGQFQPRQVKLFYVLRYLSPGTPADEERRRVLELVHKRHRLTGPPNSPRELDALAAELLPELKDSRSIPASWFDPTRSDTFLNHIAQRSSDYRNCHMVPLVVQAVRSGKRVFVVVGGSHVVMQEPALRSALSTP